MNRDGRDERDETEAPDPFSELDDGTVTDDEFRALSRWLSERELVLRVVLCRGVYMAEIRPEDGGWWLLSTGATFSRSVRRAQQDCRQKGRDLTRWEREVLRRGGAVPGEVPS